MKGLMSAVLLLLLAGCGHPHKNFIRTLPVVNRWVLLNSALDSCLALDWKGSVTFDNGKYRETQDCQELKKIVPTK